jgi:putative transposase
MTVEQKRVSIDMAHPEISIRRQCVLLGLGRSSLYYSAHRDEVYNEQLMRLIDEQYTKTPFFGVRRMTVWLRGQDHAVNHKRVARLMALMGLEAVYPRRKLSIPAPGHRIYPYLLRDVKITHADQVWSADITYIRLRRGWAYLVVVMDWFSRYVLAWELSITLETEFCVEALGASLSICTPEIFNTDQGGQFTSEAFTGMLLGKGIRISMNGRGRALDNVFVERLWRTVKYEEVYLHDYQSVREARLALGWYFRFYNSERPHQALGYKTPFQVYTQGRTERLTGLLTDSSIHLNQARIWS